MKKRLSFTYSKNAYKILENLQKDIGKSKTEVLRLALALFSYAKDRTRNSEENLAFVKNGVIKQKIII